VYSLKELGWCERFEKQLANEAGLAPARVAEENRELYRVFCEQGEFLAELSGKLRHEIGSRADFPAVGDWVLVQLRSGENRATIQRVLQRGGKFSRKIAGRKTEEQIVAANVDVVFLVSSLNREFNPRRIERYLTLAWDSGARPVIVLNKADLCENAEAFRAEAEDAAMGARVILASAVRGDGLGDLEAILQTGTTAALLGSSGVGKSSLINALLDEQQLLTRAVRESDDRGRHTTSSRQLIVVPRGGVLIDTPGMRELQLWDAGEGIGHAFGEIAELAEDCKFRDCRHQSEPGCAVREAMDARRLANYHKLVREERFLEAKQDAAVRSERRKQLRKLMRSVNQLYRDRAR
jgi:ribosome biogenesis GTPase / thiamine phosphate phosphatase